VRIFGRRLIQLVVVFVVVTFFTVFLISLVPGRPEVVVIPFDDPQETQRTAFREQNNLDDPLPVQWVKWAGRFVQGDFGNYYTSTGTRPVGPEIGSALPVSLLLMLYTQVFALIVAIPAAVWAAYRNGKYVDKVLSTTAFGFISLPSFAVVLLLSYYVGVRLGWLPAQGYTRLTDDPVQHFRTMVIPVVSLGLAQIAVYMRLLRADLIRTLQEDFILMAKAKGISDRRVLWRHALRPSSLTLLTVAGLNVGTLIGGAVVVEFLLNIPGMGYLIGYSIAARQYIALQSAVAVIAIGFVLINFFIDFLYTVLDPRIRERRA
jgi:peptide/nickel transport system permease protein